MKPMLPEDNRRFVMRVVLLFAFDVLSLVATAVIAGRAGTGTIEGSADNASLLLPRIALLLLHALLVWVWIVRPCRLHAGSYGHGPAPRRMSPDRHIFAWMALIFSCSIFAIVPLVLDNDVINRMAERTSYPRSVIARTYTWEAMTGGGKYSRYRTYPVSGLLFADSRNDGIERVPSPDGPSDDGATCFIEHVGWLGGRWISNVHTCDQPTEHVRLMRLHDDASGTVDGPDLPCLCDEPAHSPPPRPAPAPDDTTPYLLTARHGAQWVLTTDGNLQHALAALPLPYGYWVEPKVASVSPDGNRVLVGDTGRSDQLFLWNRQTGRWLALQPPGNFADTRNTYVLNDDTHAIVDCPNGSAMPCGRWTMTGQEASEKSGMVDQGGPGR